MTAAYKDALALFGGGSEEVNAAPDRRFLRRRNRRTVPTQSLVC